MKLKQQQPARQSDRVRDADSMETVEFARRREKRRRLRDLAKASRKRNRK